LIHCVIILGLFPHPVPAPSPTCSTLYHIIEIAGDQDGTFAYEDNKMDMTDRLPSLR